MESENPGLSKMWLAVVLGIALGLFVISILIANDIGSSLTYQIYPLLLILGICVICMIPLAWLWKGFPVLPIGGIVLILIFLWPVSCLTPFGINHLHYNLLARHFPVYPKAQRKSISITSIGIDAMNGFMIKMTAAASVEEIVGFYQPLFAQNGWNQIEKTENSNSELTMFFKRDDYTYFILSIDAVVNNEVDFTIDANIWRDTKMHWQSTGRTILMHNEK